MPEEMFGPYRIEQLLGRGGMGEVHRAFDTRRRRKVALKRLPAGLSGEPGFIERFRRESELAARLNNAHIVPIHDFGEIDGTLFIDMRLVDGTDLSQLIARTGPLVVARAVEIISQLADALDAAHADGLIHRDVKPSNVLVTTDSRASRDFCYLIDFGIARTLDGRGATALTASDAMIGSLDYIAPERLAGGHGDRRIDVYALACVLYEALTGEPPFRGDHAAVMYAHVHRPAPVPSALRPDLPPGLDDVVARGLAKVPGARFSSAGALAAAARAALAIEPSPRARKRPRPTITDVGAPATAVAPARRLSRRKLLALSGAGLAAMGAVVVPIVLADRDASPLEPLDDLPARSPTYARMVSRGRVVIGIRGDQPGLSEPDPSTGAYTGFDVAIALLISDRLGFAADRVEYRVVPPSLREDAITSGEVDYYVGTYTINDDRKQRVSFAGPYLSSYQGLMVRADEAASRVRQRSAVDASAV